MSEEDRLSPEDFLSTVKEEEIRKETGKLECRMEHQISILLRKA